MEENEEEKEKRKKGKNIENQENQENIKLSLYNKNFLLINKTYIKSNIIVI
jgi:hypothetical protein